MNAVVDALSPFGVTPPGHAAHAGEDLARTIAGALRTERVERRRPWRSLAAARARGVLASLRLPLGTPARTPVPPTCPSLLARRAARALGVLIAVLGRDAADARRVPAGASGATRWRSSARLRLRRARARAARLPADDRAGAARSSWASSSARARRQPPCSSRRRWRPAPIFLFDTAAAGAAAARALRALMARDPQQPRPRLLGRALAADPALRVRRLRGGHAGRRAAGRRAAGRHQPAAAGHLRARRHARHRDARRASTTAPCTAARRRRSSCASPARPPR